MNNYLYESLINDISKIIKKLLNENYMNEQLIIKKLHKAYGKRKIQVYQGRKLYGEISEFWHWISIDPKMKEREGELFDRKYTILRRIAMENLWWLLHSDKIGDDYTEQEAWEEKINRWDKGRIMGFSEGNHTSTSNFISNEEKEIALNSINNKLNNKNNLIKHIK